MYMLVCKAACQHKGQDQPWQVCRSFYRKRLSSLSIHVLCRVDAVTHAAGCLKPSVLVELQQFQTLLLEECAHPFASTASCASAASEEGRRMYYETHADQIEAVIKLLVAWVQQQQPSHSALSACLDQPGNTNAPALVTLLDNYCSG